MSDPQTNPLGDTIPWEKSQKPDNISQETWDLFQEQIQALKTGNLKRVKEIGQEFREDLEKSGYKKTNLGWFKWQKLQDGLEKRVISQDKKGKWSILPEITYGYMRGKKFIPSDKLTIPKGEKIKTRTDSSKFEEWLNS